jgi:hypothetical protein
MCWWQGSDQRLQEDSLVLVGVVGSHTLQGVCTANSQPGRGCLPVQLEPCHGTLLFRLSSYSVQWQDRQVHVPGSQL